MGVDASTRSLRRTRDVRLNSTASPTCLPRKKREASIGDLNKTSDVRLESTASLSIDESASDIDIRARKNSQYPTPNRKPLYYIPDYDRLPGVAQKKRDVPTRSLRRTSDVRLHSTASPTCLPRKKREASIRNLSKTSDVRLGSKASLSVDESASDIDVGARKNSECRTRNRKPLYYIPDYDRLPGVAKRKRDVSTGGLRRTSGTRLGSAMSSSLKLLPVKTSDARLGSTASSASLPPLGVPDNKPGRTRRPAGRFLPPLPDSGRGNSFLPLPCRVRPHTGPEA
eukprot:gene450-893_t